MMRSFTIALATVCAVAATAAQTPTPAPPAAKPGVEQSQPATPQPSQPAAAQPSQASDVSKVTMTGCLKPGTTAGTWTLETSAIPSAGSPSTPVGTSGVAGKTFNLSTKPSDNLTPHANQKIEVIGTVRPAPGAAAGANAASPSSDAASRLTFNVDSFKMVAASCQ